MGWMAAALLTVLLAGCAGQATSNEVALAKSANAETTTASPGDTAAMPRTLPCRTSDQRAVDLDVRGPGRSSPEQAVAPFADGSIVVVNANRRVATVGVLGDDGHLARVFEVSKHADGWWPDGFAECTG